MEKKGIQRRMGQPQPPPARSLFFPGMGGAMLKRPQMVIFDYGGTLAEEREFDSMAGMRALLPYMTENRDNLSPEEIDAFVQAEFTKLDRPRLEHHVEIHEHHFWRFVYEYLGVSFSLPVVDMEMILWNAAAPAVATQGMPELLACLRAQGIRTGVISNIMYSGDALTRQITHLFPEHAFEFIIATSEYVIRKPNPLIFELALRKAGLPGEAVWHCGDNFLCDIEGSSGAGITPVWYTSQPDGREKDVRCVVIDDWRQLTAWLGCTTIDN